jgi:rSAM/selenodomain-associated transferase 1
LLSALLLDTLQGVTLPGTRRVVFVEPSDACDDVASLVESDVGVRPQSGGSLGERMRSTMAELFAEGASIVVLVGSDLPDITPSIVSDAVSQLTRSPDSLVLGPAHDGGYYLIAATSVPDVFDGIEWGSAHVLEDTKAAAIGAGLRVHLLELSRDVDSPEDLNAVRAPRTRAWWSSASGSSLR